MKCPTCGTENKSTNKACFRCGNELDDSGIQPKGDANSLWYNTAEQKTIRTPPPFWGDTKGKPTYEDKSEFIVLNDEESNTNASQDLVDRGIVVPDNRQKLERMKGGRAVHVIVPARATSREQAARTRRYKIKWPRLIFSVLALIVLFAGVSFGGFWLYKLAVGSVSQIFANNRNDALAQDAKVDKVLINGEAWHKITFYGKDGEMVLVSDPKRSLPIQNGTAELLLNDQGYIPENLTNDKVTIELEATIISPDKPDKKITIPPYDIKVPLSPLKLVLPKEQSLSTNEDNILIKIKVTTGSKRVLIGNVNVTDNVSADGYASATVPLDPNGTNTIQIEVDTPKFRKNLFQLKVERPIMEIPIQLTDNPPTNTKESSVIIKGSTAQGATITTTAKLKGSLTNSNGIFSFTAELKRWGWNDISITATAANGHTSTLIHRVNHEPSLDSYSKNAWPMDNYAYLLSAVDTQIGNIYRIEGTVVKKYESDESDYYLFNCGKPGETQLLVVEYSKGDGMKVNQFYRIFADVNGTYESYPVLTARFVYALPMPSGYATAEPGATPTPEASPTPEPTSTGK